MSKYMRPQQRARNHAWQRSYKYEATAAMMRGETPPTPEEWMESVRNDVKCRVYGWTDAVTGEKHKPVSNWCDLVFHNMDVEVDENGNASDKGLHAHGVENSGEALMMSTAISRYKVSHENNLSVLTKRAYVVEREQYLCHISSAALRDGKFVYDVSKVESYVGAGVHHDYRTMISGKAAELKAGEAEQKLAIRRECHKAIREDGVPLDVIQQTYYAGEENGCLFDENDWAAHRGQYEGDEREWMQAMARALTRAKRCLTNIYIEGDGEKNKSAICDAYAERKADERGIHRVAAPGKQTTFDFADGYCGERVTIAPEAAGNSYTQGQFCDVFDPIHAGKANSRNVDKMWFAEWALMNSSRSLEEFIWGLYRDYAKDAIPGRPDGVETMDTADAAKAWRDHFESVPSVADAIWQIRRRFALWVRLVGDEAIVYVRTPATRKRHCPYMAGEIDEALDGWERFAAVSNDGTPASNEAICDAIDGAVARYYDVNSYAVTPWTCKRPSPYYGKPLDRD